MARAGSRDPMPGGASPRRSIAPAPFGALLAAALAGCGGSSAPAQPPGSLCSLPSAASLSVVQVNPANNATGVFVGASVTVRFNTCLDPATVTTGNFVLVAGTSFVPRAVSYDPATATVTVDPAGNLAYNTVHLFSASNVRGAHGEAMSGYVSAFLTQSVPESIPPATTASPAGGRYNTPQSVTLTCADNPGGTGCAATYYTVDGSTPTAFSTRYTVPIAIAADTTLRFFSTDAQGNAELPRHEVYVIDTVPPTLVGSDPPDGATGVPVNKVLTATFSEEMKASTLGPATVTADNGVAVTVSYAAGPPSAATIAPAERLACDTTYRVSIGGGATDVAGNALVQPATFGFTTTADCQEPVTAATPAGGVYLAAQAVALTCDDGAGSGCARIVYTTDGSVPSLDPPHGTIVNGASAGPISIGPGDTVLRYFAEDAAGNREALRQQAYSVSVGQGFTFVATDDGIARGVGPAPATFVPLRRGGRTAVFHRDPSNGRLYRGTERGLMASDGGEAFSFLPGAPSSATSVLAQGAKIFAGTGGGLYVSLDGGGTFVQRDLGASSGVSSIAASGYRVWAATGAGVAVSADRGWSFALRTTADGLGSSSVRGLIFDGSALYAATANGLSISTDLGATFTNYTSGLPSVSVNAIAVSGSTVYAATDAGLAISSDGGHTFPTIRTTVNGLGSNYVGEIAFDGTKLYAGTGEPWISGASNSFSVSTDATGVTFQPHAVSPPHPTLRTESIQVEGTTVRVGAYPAYYLSTDGGLTFTPKDLRGSVRKITGLGATLYAAISDGSGYGGVAISTDRGQSFTIRDRASGIPGDNVDDVAATSSGGLTYVYAATFSGLGISSDGGSTFTPKTVNASAGGNVDCVWASGATVWAGAGSTLNLSTNSGGNFTEMLRGTGSQGGLAVFGSNVYVYLAATDGLWVSPNGGTSWARRTAVEGLASSLVDDVAVDGSGQVLAATNSGLSRSLDSGATFAPAAAPQIYAYGVFAQGSTWYAAGSSGLSVSQDGGATWAARGVAQGVVATARDAWYMP